PFYYPPWFGLLFIPLLPLGYSTAKLVWFFVNVEMALVAGYLLHPALPSAPRWAPVLLSALSLFTVACVLLGQTTILVLFLAVAPWRLPGAGHDRFAGIVLAWLTIKPQLTAILLLALLIRAALERRWAVLWAFSLTMAVLVLTTTVLVPSWVRD